jgi:hypothetical protein
MRCRMIVIPHRRPLLNHALPRVELSHNRLHIQIRPGTSLEKKRPLLMNGIASWSDRRLAAGCQSAICDL